MIVTSDSIGEWTQLGFISPTVFNDWYELTPEHEVHSGRYRFTFTCKQFDEIRDYCRVRSVYVKDGAAIYSQSRKVYPQPVPIDIAMPIPSDYQSLGVNRQRLELIMVLKRRAYTSFPWQLRIEELYLPAHQQPEGIEENLQAVGQRIDKLQQTIEFVAQRDTPTDYNVNTG